jgi:hypothetical protein
MVKVDHDFINILQGKTSPEDYSERGKINIFRNLETKGCYEILVYSHLY